MTILESYTCPECGAKGSVHSIQHLMPDVRYDIVTCPECGAQWRVYYRCTDVSMEVTYLPQKSEVEAELPEEPSDSPIQ